MTSETERSFQRRVIGLAECHQWSIYHVANVRGQLKSKTSIGFPDLILVRECVLFAELKDNKHKPTPDQIAWLKRLHDANQYAGLWRPRDWEEVKYILSQSIGHWDLNDPGWTGFDPFTDD